MESELGWNTASTPKMETIWRRVLNVDPFIISYCTRGGSRMENLNRLMAEGVPIRGHEPHKISHRIVSTLSQPLNCFVGFAKRRLMKKSDHESDTRINYSISLIVGERGQYIVCKLIIIS